MNYHIKQEETEETMEKIKSFQINHLLLNPGIYVSRKDKAGDSVITTFSRICTRNRIMIMTYKFKH